MDRGIALFLILPALDKRDHGEHWWASTIRPATTAVLLAVAQALVMMLAVNAAGELYAKNLLGLCAMAVVTSICFVAVNQACVAALAFHRRFVSLILLSLQITSMGRPSRWRPRQSSSSGSTRGCRRCPNPHCGLRSGRWEDNAPAAALLERAADARAGM
ncbi:hypothetical protein [Actinomyces trachealis]|uniref:hypothetical protein n=1 Tax=Actinomyces trachealis TaxID=2763540 RepID=UPI0018928DF9|nr:hypothetical protein [Actinomyces trachealis]